MEPELEMTTNRPAQFTYPSSGTGMARTGNMEHPVEWAVELITADVSPLEEIAAAPVEPEGVFVTADQLLPLQTHVLGDEGWAYRLHSPGPYRVQFTTLASFDIGEYEFSLSFFADWRYDFGDETLPPDAADHAQIRFIIGDEVTDWTSPAHLQVNRIDHVINLDEPADLRVGFEVWSRYPASSNGMFLQAFTAKSLSAEGLEGLEQHRVVVNLLPQNATLREKWHILFRTHNARQAVLQSHDDAINLVSQGRSDSYIRLWGRDRMNPGQVEAIQNAGINTLDEPLTGVQLEPLPESTLEGMPVTVANLLAQDATLLEKWHVLQIIHEARQSMMQSHDDAIALMRSAGPGSHLRLWGRSRFHPDQLQALQENGITLVDEHFTAPSPGPTPGPAPAGGFSITHWPSAGNIITQGFGENPENYAEFKLPGHEGIDIAADFGSAVFAAADGTIIANPPKESGYGTYVRIAHTDGYESIYGHLQSVAVAVGQVVRGGDLIGQADSTGNVWPKPTPDKPHAGAHLHFSLKNHQQVTVYPFGYIDPTPFLRRLPQYPSGAIPVPPPPAPSRGKRYDLLDYLKGDGRLFEVRSVNGAQERFQTQSDGNRFYIVKNSNWEELWADDQYIWRGFDTSPDNDHYYIQKEGGREGARWANRFMQVGETFTGFGHIVKFYRKSNCSDPNDPRSGMATNKTTILAHHDSHTWNGITVRDLLELKGIGEERFFFARGFGLVGWISPWGESGINELHAPNARPNNERMRIPCMRRE